MPGAASGKTPNRLGCTDANERADMSGFDANYTFVDFSIDVKLENRFFYEKNTAKFLDAIIDTCKYRIFSLSEGTILWRAQLGYNEESFGLPKEPYPDERMKPTFRKCSEGRCNPIGIPYLYLAECKETAMAEVRPWKGQCISLGVFRINQDLTLVDTKSDNRDLAYSEDIEGDTAQSELVDLNWFLLDYQFSKPTTSSDYIGEYAPTQIISEKIKAEGYDGIRYRSSLSPGTGNNIVLFDLIMADPIKSSVYSCSSINYAFKSET